VQGVETPSQVRYVEYIARLLHDQEAHFPKFLTMPNDRSVNLKRLTLNKWFIEKAPDDLVVAVHDEAKRKIVFWKRLQPTNDIDVQSCDLECLSVQGDIRISVFGRGKLAEGVDVLNTRKCEMEAAAAAGKRILAGNEPGCMFYFIFHTFFLVDETLKLEMSVVDKAWKKTNMYNSAGTIELMTSACVDPTMISACVDPTMISACVNPVDTE